MAFAVFGPGSLYLTRTDIANATPVNIGYAQEFSLDEAGETKELYGQNQYALVAARGTIKTTGKAKAAEISGLAVQAAFHGSGMAFTAGQLLMAQNEPQPVPGSGPYTVTVNNAATFDTDLGVIYAATGLPLTNKNGGSLTAAGQYQVNAATGVYTFDSGDAGVAMLITYAWAKTGAGGQTGLVTNQLIGTSPTFQLDYSTVLNTKAYYLRVYQCISGKLAQTFKLTDFMMPELDFDVFANPAGQVYKASFADVG